MNKKCFIPLLFAFFSMAALAQNAPSYPGFDTLDEDGDGMLSDEEARNSPSLQRLGFEYDTVDTSGDGFIDEDEYNTFAKQ